MPVRKIVINGEPVLHRRAAPVDPTELGTAAFKRLVLDMIETMRSANGVGLAAPQIGVGKRLFVADSPSGPIALVNPEFTWVASRTVRADEGCLSLPGQVFPVRRHAAVKVRALNADGQEVNFEAKGFLARVLQHELDHLDGILIDDRAKEQGAAL